MRVTDSFLRLANRIVSPSGFNARLPILFYHRVLNRPDPLLPDTPDVRLFDVHMGTLARIYNVIGLEEALQLLQSGKLPPLSVCVTFDDGYRDNFEIALPILQRHGLKATFFLASGFLGKGRMFVDTIIEAVRRLPAGPVDLTWFGLGVRKVGDAASRLAMIDDLLGGIKYRNLEERLEACDRIARLVKSPLPDDLMMTPEHVRAMYRCGMSIGGHTRDHPILNCVHPEEARHQITSDRETIASITGSAPTIFAYPNGKPDRDYGLEHARMVREAGYAAALTTAAGCAGSRSDPYQLPRQSPWQRTSIRLVAGITRATRSKSHGIEVSDDAPVAA